MNGLNTTKMSLRDTGGKIIHASKILDMFMKILGCFVHKYFLSENLIMFYHSSLSHILEILLNLPCELDKLHIEIRCQKMPVPLIYSNLSYLVVEVAWLKLDCSR